MAQSSQFNDDLPTDDYSHLTGCWCWQGRECRGADDATFVPRNNLWATDKKGLFKQDTRVRVKDPAACRVLNLLFATDGQQVYYVMGVAKAVEDVATFGVLDCGQYLYEDGGARRYGYARDSKHGYGHDFFSGAPKALKGADVATFSRLGYGYAKDASCVWRDGDRIKKADSASFAPIDDLYSKDAKHVFYGDTPLEGADPATFRVIARTTGVDARHVYFQRTLLPGANPPTFGMDDDTSWVGRDDNLVFYGPQQVMNADPATFTQIGDSRYYRDKHAIYYLSEQVPDADLATFEVVGNSWSRARDKHREYEEGKPVTK
jgi:hypothetical protein